MNATRARGAAEARAPAAAGGTAPGDAADAVRATGGTGTTAAAAAATLRPVLAVLEDAAAGAWLIECSASLAQALGRELALVHVQNTLALAAAALPETRALAHAGAPWAPFAPQDLERAWRAEVARLQALAAPIALRHALPWSLRTVRGEPGAVARGLLDETDLLFLGAAGHATARAAVPARVRAATPAALAVLDDGSDAAARAVQAASRLVAAMPAAWRLRRWPLTNEAAFTAWLQQPPPFDALVLPRHLATAARWPALVRLRRPVLLLG